MRIPSLLALVLCSLFFGACRAAPTVACGDGSVVCGGGTSCIDLGSPDQPAFICATSGQLAGCASLEENQACTTPGGKIGTCISSAKVCIENICGDGILAATERCDDGTDFDDDGLTGCADPDCFGRCYPTCSTTYSGPCDRATGPRCGDATCDTAFEDYLLCPRDCPPP